MTPDPKTQTSGDGVVPPGRVSIAAPARDPDDLVIVWRRLYHRADSRCIPRTRTGIPVNNITATPLSKVPPRSRPCPRCLPR